MKDVPRGSSAPASEHTDRRAAGRLRILASGRGGSVRVASATHTWSEVLQEEGERDVDGLRVSSVVVEGDDGPPGQPVRASQQAVTSTESSRVSAGVDPTSCSVPRAVSTT